MTTIGTPLSASATRVMTLGAGELGKEVIIELQRLGVEVVAVDRYENAPGMQVAHRSHVINMLDSDELRRVIETEKPHLVVPRDRGDRHADARRHGSRGLANHPDRPGGAAHHEPRGHSSPGGGNLGSRHLTLPVRGDGGGIPCRDRRHRHALCRQARHEFLRQGPDHGAFPGGRDGLLARRPGGCEGRRRQGHRRGLHRLRLRDHPAHGAA